MRLNGLRTFRNVHETGSISAAAKRQNLSQPAVSRLLSNLEQQLRMKLFFRNGRRLVPTPEGEKFYALTHRLLASIDELPRIAKDIREGSNLTVRMLAMRRVTTEVALPVVAQLHKEVPQLEIEIEIIARRELEPHLNSMDYDIAIGTLPMASGVANIKPVAVQKLYVVLPGDHPMADRQSIGIEQVQDLEMIALPKYTRHRQEVDDIFRASAIEPKISITVSSVEPAVELVSKGMGYTLADGLMRNLTTRLGCVMIPLSPERQVIFAIIRPPLRVAHNGIDRLEEAIRSRFEEFAD